MTVRELLGVNVQVSGSSTAVIADPLNASNAIIASHWHRNRISTNDVQFANAAVSMVSTDLGTSKLIRPVFTKAPSLIIMKFFPPFINSTEVRLKHELKQ